MSIPDFRVFDNNVCKTKIPFFTIELFWMVLDYIRLNHGLVHKYDNQGICWHIMVLFLFLYIRLNLGLVRKYDNQGICWHIMFLFLFLEKPCNQGYDLRIHSCKIHMCKIWQYWLWSLKFGDTKSEKNLPKNFDNCCSGEIMELIRGIGTTKISWITKYFLTKYQMLIFYVYFFLRKLFIGQSTKISLVKTGFEELQKK